MNDSNLIPMNQRTESEQREITRKGGIESGKARRRKKALKDISKVFLNARPTDDYTIKGLKAAGFDDDEMTNAAGIILSLFDEAIANGNTKAAELLFKYAGEDPEQQRKDAELKLKRELLKLKEKEQARRYPEPDEEMTVFEKMVMELYYQDDAISREMLRKIDPRLDILQQIKEIQRKDQQDNRPVIIVDIPDDGRETRTDL